ncbi:hypothetical protein JTB14_005388 [Gonioctena quinquepunctata]|nr:hypothetical protein JTB14_003406 [Gonioctena quinquepunctata]KAG5869861.1 hypothetical protein JTB14_005388 [Gonioctena quinquepunctata]
MASNEVNCFICGDILQESEVIEVKEKGLETFRQSNDIEEEETDTILEQINDEIENEEDHDETDDPIVDDAEETSVFDISIGIEDDENPTPGPSTRMKRRKLN